jgi:hypothetical protein
LNSFRAKARVLKNVWHFLTLTKGMKSLKFTNWCIEYEVLGKHVLYLSIHSSLNI